MALNDQNLVFSSGQAITATAASTNTYDLLQGLMLLTASGTYPVPPAAIIGNASVFGEDFGLGRGVGTPSVEVFSGAGTPTTATSLQIALQGAVDNNSGNVSGQTFVPYIETRGIPLASLAASSRLAAFDWPRAEIKQSLPRFINLNYIVVGANFAGLTVTSYVNLGGTSAQTTLGQYPANY